jgi:hypothetical protein
MIEADLNAAVELADGSTETDAQAVFDSVHPLGKGVSVSVNDVSIELKDGHRKLPWRTFAATPSTIPSTGTASSKPTGQRTTETAKNPFFAPV